MRRLLLSFSLAITALANAQISGPGAWVPGPANPGPGSTPMPYYFSATNCRASGVINPVAYRNIVWIWLSINDEVVKEEYPDWNGLSVGLGAIFDSTHFQPGSTVTVSIDGMDDFGDFYHAEGSSIVKNRALLYDGIGGIWFTASLISTLLPTTKWNVFTKQAPWTANDVFYQMEDPASNRICTILNLSCHGNVSTSGIGMLAAPLNAVNDPPPSETFWSIHNPAWPAELDFLSERQADMTVNTPYPPFNVSENIPISFAHLDSCLTGADSKFDSILYPNYDNYGDLKNTDQAVIAYSAAVAHAGGISGYFNANNYSHIPQELRRSQPIYNALGAGLTVFEAKERLIQKLSPWHIIGYNETIILGSTISIVRQLDPEEITIIGDPYTRITTVYTGDDSDNLGAWYK